MKKELWIAQQLKKIIETKREALYPVPVPTAQHRLQVAFISTIKISQGWLQGKNRYLGRVNEDNVIVQFWVGGIKSQAYSLEGHMHQHGQGTYFKMIVKDEMPPYKYLLALAFMVYVLYIDSFGGLFFACVLLPLMLLERRICLIIAANKVAALVKNIVLKTE